MNAEKTKRISKNLSYVLRHQPDSVGLELDDSGWVDVDALLQAFNDTGKTLTLELLQEVVRENDKQRFEFSDDGVRIRARQGHSVDVELGYEAAMPPDVLFHGTATRNLESIFATGLNKGNRHHVHMSTNKQTMLQVAQRHGKPVVLAIDAARMVSDGYQFFVTGNQVWLTEEVPPQYLSFASDT
jgi:putative RNA 2'-phosphotransferase